MHQCGSGKPSKGKRVCVVSSSTSPAGTAHQPPAQRPVRAVGTSPTATANMTDSSPAMATYPATAKPLSQPSVVP